MEIWKRNLWLLWVGCFITAASFSMVIPFLPLFLIHMGVNEHLEMWSGLIFSSAFLAGAIAAPYWGAMGDKYGRKPMIVRAGFVLCVIYLLTSLVTNPYQLLGLRVLQGLLSGFIPGSIALIGTNTPEDKMGYAMATISTSTATGSILGPLLGGVIANIFGSRIAFASAGVFVLMSALLVLFWVKEEKFVPSKGRNSIIGSMKMAANNRPFMVILGLMLLTQFSVMTIEPVLPLYIVQIGSSLEDASLMAGIVFSLVGVAGVLFASRWGKLADKIGFHQILFIGLLAGGLGNLAQIPFHDIWGFSIVRFVYGAFFCAVFPALNGLIIRTTAIEFRGRAFGLSQTANMLGGMLGPLVGGAISGMFSIHSVFWVTGILLIIAAGAAYWSKGSATQRAYDA
ncbi:MFS transporter [Paenibacillus agricola]|uniref:Multidrug efflux MFS transporter n=1 Tax=Paenibacillus agricola TaxID=2716264 RepID=A0ABX0JCP5_9BACL|nr:MFS transporter [Paenibacillus agricola]NHN31989.1 multidrug efflux MFS transporter [Paenibacillus agricola]